MRIICLESTCFWKSDLPLLNYLTRHIRSGRNVGTPRDFYLNVSSTGSFTRGRSRRKSSRGRGACAHDRREGLRPRMVDHSSSLGGVLEEFRLMCFRRRARWCGRPWTSIIPFGGRPSRLPPWSLVAFRHHLPGRVRSCASSPRESQVTVLHPTSCPIAADVRARSADNTLPTSLNKATLSLWMTEVLRGGGSVLKRKREITASASLYRHSVKKLCRPQ